jgi:hypothetical protein
LGGGEIFIKNLILLLLFLSYLYSSSCKRLDYHNGKIPFDGVYVKVDSLGNICIKENEVWRGFFPLCIYSDKRREHNYTAYTVGGRFNCMIAWNASNLKNIRDSNMKGILDTDPYQDGEQLSGELAKEIKKIKEQGLMSDLLFYYTDYEKKRVNAWRWHREKREIISTYDPNGHPIYSLNGNSINNPKSQENIYISGNNSSDIVGTYVYERWNRYRPNGPKRVIELLLGEQTNPMVVAQINYGVGGDMPHKYPRDPVGHRFTPIAMASVAQGAKAIGFWKDLGSSVGVKVEDNSWWDDLPKFNSDIEKMMDADIVQSPTNPFGVVCSSHYYRDRHGRVIVLDNIFQKDRWGYYLIPDDYLSVSVGTRVVNQKGYAIISNWNSTAQQFECSVDIKEMGYRFSKLYDFINDIDNIGLVNGNRFKITIPAYSWLVIEFL